MRNPIKTALSFIMVCLVATSAMAAVPELSEKMTQGQFALWLVNAVGASSKLPAIPTEQDAVDFLMKLNISPKDGWKKNAPITKEFLASLLGDDNASKMDFNDLVAKVRDHAMSLFDNTDLGAFRAFSTSASGSTTI